MQDALNLFNGSPLESLFVIANSKELLKKGDVKSALEALSAIKANQTSYLEARSLMADIYLKQKDRKRYAACFREVVEKRPTVDSCILLGDAFMKIQEPLEAILVYQSALKAYPDQAMFVSKIGSAYVMMHDYSKACAYYKAAIASATTGKLALQYDLAHLVYKLKKYEEADGIVQEALAEIEQQENSIIPEAKLKRLQGDINLAMFQPAMASSSYIEAKESLTRLLNRESGKEAIKLQIEIASICVCLGKLSETEVKQYDKACSYYNEAIQIQPDNRKAVLLLSKLHVSNGNHVAAQNSLNALLEKDPTSVDASIIMAEILCEKASFQSSFFHYRQVIDRSPTDFETMVEFIDLARRLNKLEEIDTYLSVTKTNAKLNIGFHYCRGLYLRYTNALDEALKQFVICRKDSVWGERACHQLIEIFLNPGDETMGGEALKGTVDSSQSTSDLNADMDLVGVLTADKLIKVIDRLTQELPQRPKSSRTIMAECTAMIATKQRPALEQAIEVMMELLKIDPDFVPALYVLSNSS